MGSIHNYGNTNSQKHGGEGAIKRIGSDQPLDGLAADFEQAAISEVESTSMVSAMKRRAIRHMAVADLFYAAIQGAEDLKTLDKLVKRYGWLNSSAQRQLMQVHELERQMADDDILDMVLDG